MGNNILEAKKVNDDTVLTKNRKNSPTSISGR